MMNWIGRSITLVTSQHLIRGAAGNHENQ